MVKVILPVVGDLMTRVFAAGRNYPKECKAARIDIERHVADVIRSWGGQMDKEEKLTGEMSV